MESPGASVALLEKLSRKKEFPKPTYYQKKLKRILIEECSRHRWMGTLTIKKNTREEGNRKEEEDHGGVPRESLLLRYPQGGSG